MRIRRQGLNGEASSRNSKIPLQCQSGKFVQASDVLVAAVSASGTEPGSQGPHCFPGRNAIELQYDFGPELTGQTGNHVSHY